MITIDWLTRIISVPFSFMTLTSPGVYSFDVDDFRRALKDIEDSEAGIPQPDTHRHNTEVVLSGVTYARTVEIINGYTVSFPDGTYTVDFSGANHNVADVTNPSVSGNLTLLPNNSAGLIVGSGSGTATVDTDEIVKKLVPFVVGAAQIAGCDC